MTIKNYPWQCIRCNEFVMKNTIHNCFKQKGKVMKRKTCPFCKITWESIDDDYTREKICPKCLNGLIEGASEEDIKRDKSPDMREFRTGATRDSDVNKPDYEGFLSPLAIRRYGEYMNKHRKQSDGKIRASDNWQNGIPLEVYMKSMLRHVMDLWLVQRHNKVIDPKDGLDITKQEALCAILFNAFGFLHELENDKPEK